MSVQLNRSASGSISIDRTERSGSVGQASNEYGISQSESGGTRASNGTAARRSAGDAVKSFFKAVGDFFKNLFSGGTRGAGTPPQQTTTTAKGGGFDVSGYHTGKSYDTKQMMSDVIEGRNPELDRAFTAYSKSRYSDECMNFLKAVHDYKNDPTPGKARGIVDMFRQIKEQLADGGAPADAFAKVEAGVYDMTQHDLMAQFALKQGQSK
jgi:hypothetical protein